MLGLYNKKEKRKRNCTWYNAGVIIWNNTRSACQGIVCAFGNGDLVNLNGFVIVDC